MSGYESDIRVVCLIIMGFYMGHFGIVEPLNSAILEQRKVIESSEEQKRRYGVILRSKEAVEYQWDLYAKYFQQRSNDEEQFSGILSDIEKMADSTGLSLDDRKPYKVPNGDFYNKYSIELTFEGEMKNLAEFFYLLQGEPYFFDIDELRLEKSQNQNSFLKCFLVVSRIWISS